jgi:hypothetical protein
MLRKGEENIFNQKTLARAMSYAEYGAMIENLLAEGKTTGADHSPAMIEYTKLNVQRMKRGDATAVVAPPLAEMIRSISRPQIWVVLTEAWCGDAAQNLPLFPKMAALNPLVSLKFLLRDENPRVMEAFLTGGARSIPKFVVLDAETRAVLGQWGPRPAPMQALAADYKAGKMSKDEFQKTLHLRYAQDRFRALNDEMIVLFSDIVRRTS